MPKVSRRNAYLLGLITAISLAYFAERSTRSAEIDSSSLIDRENLNLHESLGRSFKPVKRGLQANAAGITQISLATRDLLYDPIRNTIYASVPSNANTNANSVVSINPATGQIQVSITGGGNPVNMAMSGDGHYLYVGLDDSASVRKQSRQGPRKDNVRRQTWPCLRDYRHLL